MTTSRRATYGTPVSQGMMDCPRKSAQPKLPVRRIITASALALALAFPASASAWPTWGNEEKGDCTFAAVANWELVQTQWLFPRQPTEAEVIQDYEEANPNDQGFSVGELFEYWREKLHRGRRGEHLQSVSPL
jgi:hypothetical protein